MTLNIETQKNWTDQWGKWALLALIPLFLFCSLAESKEKKKGKSAKSQKVAQSAPSKRLKKDVSFDDYSVKGKYLVPLNSVTVVEEEKNIDDLIGVRKNFDDRTEAAKEMR